MNRRPLLALLILPLSVSLALGADSKQSKPAKPAAADTSKPSADDDYELQKLLVDTLDQVERNYVKNVTRRELVEAAIKGVLDKLDPYSSYISPDELTTFRSSVESEFGGIGIQITVDGGHLKVLSPLVGTPAYRAGVLAGDRIVEIEGKSTTGLTIDQAVKRLKGPVGTSVTMTLLHPGRTKPEKMTITRENIRVDTVLGDHRGPDDAWDFIIDRQKRIGYLRVSAFSRETSRELRRALEKLQQEKVRGLIMDLRFNPGGLLNSAIEVSDLFIEKGRIVSTKGRNTPERVWNARAEGTFLGFPMVVLVNRFSASASEIVAACLQDHQRATIIGERTWGKGSVQNVIELEEGHSALKLTTAGYRRPNGKNIHRFPDSKESDEWGVSPDKGYELKLSDAELMRVVESRRQRDIVKPKTIVAAAKEPAVEKAHPSANDTAKSPPEKPDPKAAAGPTDAKPPAAQEASARPSEEMAALEQTKHADPQLRMALDYLTGELARAK